MLTSKKCIKSFNTLIAIRMATIKNNLERNKY